MHDTPKYDPLRKIDTKKPDEVISQEEWLAKRDIMMPLPKPEPHPVHFGRWLLKHCETATVDGFFTWKYGEEYKDTLELYNIYKQTV
jgi:hypothetical protein